MRGCSLFLSLFLICRTIWNRSVQSLTVLIFLLEFLISKCVLHCARSAGIAVNLLWLTGRRELTRTEGTQIFQFWERTEYFIGDFTECVTKTLEKQQGLPQKERSWACTTNQMQRLACHVMCKRWTETKNMWI